MAANWGLPSVYLLQGVGIIFRLSIILAIAIKLIQKGIQRDERDVMLVGTRPLYSRQSSNGF